MKRVGMVFGLALAAMACATGGDMMMEIMDSGVPDAGAETPGDGSGMQYVGNSEEVFGGFDYLDDPDTGERTEQGRYVWYAACQDTFGPGHRMCTADEVIYTVNLPQLTEGVFAWIDPVAETCDSLRAAVDHLGRISNQVCTNNTNGNAEYFRPIACCGPK